MPSYLELQSEQVWWDQFVPANLTNLLINPLRTFYNLSGGAVGAAGDNNHVYGRHRSANWDLTSRYCTDRSYGTTNNKDKQGDLNWYRAVDVGIQGQPLWDASHRVDQAVRAGRAPAIAEWFGTFNGQTVVGWFEGHPSSSDSSHLWHLHVGFWNQYANDANVMKQTFEIITGGDVTAQENWEYKFQNPGKPPGTLEQAQTYLGYANKYAFDAMNAAKEAVAKLNEVLALLQQGGGQPPTLVGLTPQALDDIETQVYNVLNDSKIVANNPAVED